MHTSAVVSASCISPVCSLPVSCPGWPWCVGAPGASGRLCPSCWQRGAAGWLWSPGMKMQPAPRWHVSTEVQQFRHRWRLFIEALRILLQQCKNMLQKTFPYPLTGFKFSIFQKIYCCQFVLYDFHLQYQVVPFALR